MSDRPPVPLRDLFVEALERYRSLISDGDDFDGYWAVVERAAEAGRDAAALALRMSNDADAARRHVAYDLLGVLAAGHADLRSVIGRELLGSLQMETGENLRASIVAALAETRWAGAIQDLITLVPEAKGDYGWAVTRALALCTAESASVPGFEALLGATESSSADVREAAVMAFADILTQTGPSVCDVLARRLFDPVDAIRDRAIHGLARRRDGRVVSAIISGLDRRPVSPEILRAARAFPRREYLPALAELREGGVDVTEIISRCTTDA